MKKTVLLIVAVLLVFSMLAVSCDQHPAGEYTISWGAKLADGTIATFYTVTVIVEDVAVVDPAV